MPIGPSTTNPFTGSYEGNGKTITGLTITTPAVDYQGLFGYVSGASAEVKNLNLASVSITGTTQSYIGGVAAQVQNGGLIENCSVQGSISGLGDVGGIVGHNYLGTVRGCYVTSVTTITGSGTDVGGVVGYNWSGSSLVERCYAEANVNGSGNVGGVVGLSNGTVQNCYATGNVSGSTEYIGGVVGLSNGTVQNCYATGNVSGIYNIGGISANYGTGTVQNCVALGKYVTPSLIGTPNIGRICWDWGTGTKSNNYARDDMLVDGSTVTGTHNDKHGVDLDVTLFIPLTTVFSGGDWGTSSIWTIPSGVSPVGTLTPGEQLPTLTGVGGAQNPVLP